MEDVFSVAYQQTEDEKDLEYAYFGIFDGHGGREAAVFAKEHLMDQIVRQKGFWAEDDETVQRAIHEGFVQTHHAMWKELDKWPKTASGLPSTAGTTASIAFIRRGKIYIGHVGDSAIVLGMQDPDNPGRWIGQCLTRDHKPESSEESQRIQRSGGKVVSKSGVPRVVWNRPKMGHKGPVRRSTHIDEIPFLAVARSLGDLWSYNSDQDAFVVSPEPDTFCYNIDITKHRCLILGTDGCWNMLSAQQTVHEVCSVEKSNEQHMLNPSCGRQWINPSKRLVDSAIDLWNSNSLRADNTSVVTVMLDPPGPPRAQVLKKQEPVTATASTSNENHNKSGFSIISRYPNASNLKERNLASENMSSSSKILHDFQRGNVCRLSNSSKIVNKVTSSTNDSEETSSLASTVVLPTNNSDIQCKDISSSEDGDSSTKSKSTLEMTPKLSRELSALQLSPTLSKSSSGRRGRTRSSLSKSSSDSDTENEHPKNDSDTENEAPKENTTSKRMKNTSPTSSLVEPEEEIINPHFLRSKEARIKKSSSVCHLSGSTASPTTVMSLRPRPQTLVTTSGTNTSGHVTSGTPNRKRKPETDVSEKFCKSPKMMSPAAPVIQLSKPVMTRSRTARVLHLKK